MCGFFGMSMETQNLRLGAHIIRNIIALVISILSSTLYRKLLSHAVHRYGMTPVWILR